MTRYNSSAGEEIVEKRYTPGRIALRANTPTLCDVATKWGKVIAQKWIEVQLTGLEEHKGNSTFSPEAKSDAARLLYSYYRDMNVGEFLLFFAWYKLGKYKDIYSGGVEKVMYAFREYREQRDAELFRLEAEFEYQRRETERTNNKCISYDEYLKTKNQ